MNRRYLIQSLIGLSGGTRHSFGDPVPKTEATTGPLVKEVELIRARVDFATVQEAADHFRKLVVGGVDVNGEPKQGFVVLTLRIASGLNAETLVFLTKDGDRWAMTGFLTFDDASVLKVEYKEGRRVVLTRKDANDLSLEMKYPLDPNR